MTGHILQSNVIALIRSWGDLGVFLGMFFESSIVPIPSEVIVMTAGAIGIPLTSIVIFGALGSTAGAMAGYFLGRYAAMPVILKFGKFILIKPHHIYKTEAFAKKYGAGSVLIGRILPIVPFKVFSIAAGITGIPFVQFVVCTLIGVLPRIYLLAVFGSVIARYKEFAVLAVISLVSIFLAFRSVKVFYSMNKLKKDKKGGQ